MRISTTGRRVKPWAIALWLLLWQGAAMLVGRDFLLASPVETLGCFLSLAQTADFYLSALASMGRILLGFGLGVCLGVALAALSARFAAVAELLAPLVAVLRAIPVASFVVVALIWIPSRRLSVLISFLIVFPLIYGSVLSEIGRTDVHLMEMARVFRLGGWRRAVYIHGLSAAEGFCAACASGMGLAWKSGIAAELIAIPAGSIGERLYQAKVYLMTGELFAWTLLIIMLSAICTRLMTAALHRIVWRLEGM